MSLAQSAVHTFANHQTFHPRFGWITKGYDAAVADPDVFNRPEAPVTLGVGKNMVEAIRFWCLATHVIARAPKPGRPRISVALPTALGHALLGDEDGLDPYLEDPTTLWVLHWQAVAAPTLLPVWWSTLNDLSALEFTEPDLLRFCVDEVAATAWAQPTESSIQKDVDCLIRMYCSRPTRARQSLDELLDSPFRELGLLQPSPAGQGVYRFARGVKPTLSPAAITYACLDYVAMTDPHSKTVSLTRLTVDPGSPGRLLKLTEDVIEAALEKSAAAVHGMRLARPAGATQLALDDDPTRLAKAVLWEHHHNRLPNLALPHVELAGPAARSSLLSAEQACLVAAESRKGRATA